MKATAEILNSPDNPVRKRSARGRIIQFIQTCFPKLRPDLWERDELREARLVYCTNVLKLKLPLKSMRRLSDRQLSRVADAIRKDMQQQRLPNTRFAQVREPAQKGCGPDQMGTLVHLAGNEQIWAMERVIEHLGWTPVGVEQFFMRNFRVKGPRMIRANKANDALYLLLYMAAHKALKYEYAAEQGRHHSEVKVPRLDAQRRIPLIKQQLGIGVGAKQAEV